MRQLNGAELVEFIMERQAKSVRSLVGQGVTPKLVIIRTNPDPVVDSYMRLKSGYGKNIGVDVEVVDIEQDKTVEKIKQLNKDETVHGIIVQIPLPDPTKTNEILNSVSPDKDVDGLGEKPRFDAATPMAVNWLLAGYNVELRGKKLIIVGHGRLVGKPLEKIWKLSGLDVEVADKNTKNLAELTRQADVLVCATGVPGLITNDMIKPEAVIVDAGVATDTNGLVGDVASNVRELPYVTITPIKGGVGPLTVSALFENVIHSAREKMK